jgi:hypothetical protein
MAWGVPFAWKGHVDNRSHDAPSQEHAVIESGRALVHDRLDSCAMPPVATSYTRQA